MRKKESVMTGENYSLRNEYNVFKEPILVPVLILFC